MKKNFIYIFLITLIMGCNKNVKKEIFWINSFKEKCVGVAPKECLQIKKSEDASWENFYDSIDGFDYIPGSVYKIEVEVEKHDKNNTPADKSIYSYKLVKVISKEADKRLRINDVWVASSIDKIRLDKLEEMPRVEVSVKNKQLQGTDGCNSIIAPIKNLTDKEISFGMAMGTRKMCPNMEIANAFNNAIMKVKSYKIENSKLYLYNDEGNEVLQFFKID